MNLVPDRWVMSAMAAVAAAALAAGCSGGTGHPSAASATTVATSAPTAPTTTAPAPTTAPGPAAATTAPPTNAVSSRCRSTQLSAALTNVQGAAGTIYSHLTFTNKSAAACTMSGYPGVSFVDGSGHQIGPPVPKMAGYGGTVTLAAGGTAAALFLYHDAYVGTSPQCTAPVAAHGLRVYPPDETAALFVSDATTACASPAATGVAEVSAVTNPASLPG